MNKAKNLRSYLRELPEYVSSYILEYYSGESINTQIGYSIDIRVFFNYLCEEIFSGKKTTEKITCADIEKVTVSDLIHFKSYLCQVSKSSIVAIFKYFSLKC